MDRIPVVTNHLRARIDASSEVLARLRDYWSFQPPGAHFAPSHRLWLRERARAKEEGRLDEPIAGWDGKIRMFKGCWLSSGLFRATRKAAELELGVKFVVERHVETLEPFIPGFQANGAYEHQNECVAAMLTALPKGGGIVLACTGSGKTKTAAQFFSKLRYSCLFVVHRKNLLYQSQKEIAKWLGEEVGIVGDSKFAPKRITVATIQTLDLHQGREKFDDWLRTVKIIVVDELHKQMAKRNFALIEHLEPLARYGLTATLQLSKKPVRMEAWAFAGPVLYEFPIVEGIKKHVVSDGSVLQLLFDEEYDWSKVNATYHQEYDLEVIDNEVKQQAIKAQVELLVKQGRYVLVLVERVRHVAILDALFKGTKHRLVWGGIKNKRRESSQAKFETGDVRLLIANGVFKDGVDIKRVDTIFDLTEWKSKDDTLQKFGRGVRLHTDKESLLYIDYGTQAGRFRRNAVSRSRALTAAGIKVEKVKVGSVKEAVMALKKVMKREI